MASITDLIDFGNLAREVGKNAGQGIQDMQKAAQLFRKAKAISATANKYVVKYPVLVSTRISDVKTAVAITKQIELECARFIILAAGMRPLLGDAKNQIGIQLNSIFTEESFKNLKMTIEPASDEEFYSAENYLQSIENVVRKDPFKKHTSFIRSQEMQGVDTTTNPGDPELPKDADKDIPKDSAGNFIINGKKYDPNKKEDWDFIQKELNKKKKDYIDPVEDGTRYHEILSKLTKEGPTIVKLTFKLENGADVSIPLAVKATLVYVDSSDCVDVLNRSRTFSSGLKTALKIISGEICFTDWLFNLKEAQKDVERERNLGSIPWYRRLLSGKNKYRTKNLMQVLGVQSDFIKGKTKEDMPMCTIVVTEDELFQCGYRISKLMQDRKIVTSIMDEYMLLCFGIVDTTNDMVYFFFSGEDDYRAIDINKVGSSGGSNSGDAVAAKLVTLLGKSIDINNRH